MLYGVKTRINRILKKGCLKLKIIIVIEVYKLNLEISFFVVGSIGAALQILLQIKSNHSTQEGLTCLKEKNYKDNMTYLFSTFMLKIKRKI